MSDDADRMRFLRSSQMTSRVSAALLTSSVVQSGLPHGSSEFNRATRRCEDLTDRLLDVDLILPFTAILGVAHSAAVIIRALSEQLGVDPQVVMENYEMDLLNRHHTD